jgi:hypothetical protein
VSGDVNPSIIDVLLGRHQHEPVMKLTVAHRLYHNYRLHEPSRRLEVSNGGRQRNKTLFDDPEHEIAKTIKARGY